MGKLSAPRGVALTLFFLILVFSVSCGKKQQQGTSVSNDIPGYTVETKEGFSMISRDKSKEIVEESDMNFTLDMLPLSIDHNGDIRDYIEIYNNEYPDNAVRILSLGKEDHEREVAMLNAVNVMAAGGGPDILVVDREQMELLQERGLLVPLDEFLTEDHLREIVPAVKDAGTIAGSFYGMAPYIDGIRTCLVRREIYGKSTWSLNDIQAVMSEHSEFERTFVGYYDTETFVSPFSYFGIYNLEGPNSPFIDYENRKSDFDSTDFMLILEKAFDESKIFLPEDSFEEEKALSFIDNYSHPTHILKSLAERGDRYNYVGVPRKAGAGNKALIFYYFVLNKNGQHLEEAGEFIKYIMSRGCQDAADSGISIRTDYAQDDVEKNENGIGLRRTLLTYRGWVSQWDFVTDYDVDPVILATDYEDFMLNCFWEPVSDETISDILYEETEDYFKVGGDVNAVAARIQERVQKYLSEK